MTRKTIDDSIRKFFDDFVDDVELCDEHGRVIARLQCSTPWTDPKNWEALTPDITQEEWERLRDSDEPGWTTQQLKDHLRSL